MFILQCYLLFKKVLLYPLISLGEPNLLSIYKMGNRLGSAKKRGVTKMIGTDFYSIFYIGVMVVLAVINGIQLGASKGYPFRRFANGLQVLVFMIIPAAFALGGQTSGFFFWTIMAFALSVALDAVELTLIYCGKIKAKDPLEEPVKPTPAESQKKGLGKKVGNEVEKIVTKNPVAAHSLTVIISFLLNFAVFFISVLLVTGYSFQ
jgi:hypothetical protein